MDFAEWVQVVTQTVTTLVAVVMAWLAYQAYLRTPVQEPEAEPEEAAAEEVPSAQRRQMVFQTSKQTTWLYVTDHGLECHLGDRARESSTHQWVLLPDECRRILSERWYGVNPTYKARTGLFRIGTHRNWLYSKKLFPDPQDLEMTIEELLREAIA
ncbi:MAG: hypothetical protein QGI83_00320 [Candidatus Latescibacteria bacterium]|jgi:hypothetical protein|nr:hypothetical protein [Candidatus Latescibacterota bacterium]